VSPRTPPRQAGIVHLGLSNFHRAHQAVYTARALDVDDGPWGVVGVARRSRDVLDAMRAQEGAYAVLTLADDRADVDVVAVHTDLLLTAADPEAVVTQLASPAISLVTLTVTEAGYTANPGQGGLDLGEVELAADLDGRAPLTIVGQLAGALRRRHRIDAPCTVLSCDNLVGNGAVLRGLVTEFLNRCVPEPERSELLDWCAARVRFPSSMVDRIVPRTTDRHREVVRTRTGLRDASPVPAEAFSMWVIEDDFATARPAWDRAGAIFSADVHAYEVLKIRLLNGTHSLLAYLGMLTGAPTIAAAVADHDVRAPAEAFLDEVSSTCMVPPTCRYPVTGPRCSRCSPTPLPDTSPARSAPTAPSRCLPASRSPSRSEQAAAGGRPCARCSSRPSSA
jgi:fructuronate reductase